MGWTHRRRWTGPGGTGPPAAPCTWSRPCRGLPSSGPGDTRWSSRSPAGTATGRRSGARPRAGTSRAPKDAPTATPWGISADVSAARGVGRLVVLGEEAFELRPQLLGRRQRPALGQQPGVLPAAQERVVLLLQPLHQRPRLLVLRDLPVDVGAHQLGRRP